MLLAPVRSAGADFVPANGGDFVLPAGQDFVRATPGYRFLWSIA